jgi:hypothetical protein
MRDQNDPRIRLMARGAFPCADHMDTEQVESNRAKWILAVEYLGDKWKLLHRHERHDKASVTPLLSFKKENRGE